MTPRFLSLALRTLALSLCASMALAAMAQKAPDWQPITASERGRFYIDNGSIRREQGIARFRTLLDYAKPQATHNGKAFLSAQSLMEIDCKADLGRIVEMNYYTGAMMGGQRIEKQGMVQDWQDIAPESPVRRMAARVCR
ncbi:MAG: hypothetical protein RIT26_796 [Pseudomonadota bacterium]